MIKIGDLVLVLSVTADCPVLTKLIGKTVRVRHVYPRDSIDVSAESYHVLLKQDYIKISLEDYLKATDESTNSKTR